MAKNYFVAQANMSDFEEVGCEGTRLERVTIIPQSTTCGPVTIKDSSDNEYIIFQGGVLGDIKPFTLHLGMQCKVAWRIKCGSDVMAIAIKG